jgi:prepilin-type N-terminal cleavage/methylation domain-containing protein
MRPIRSQSGFTLIETLVAVSVLLISLMGPLTIASKGLSTALFARDQVVAFYLAGEAVEYVRNIRDTNILNGRPWLAGLDACLAGNTCSIDIRSGVVSDCAGSCAPLRYDPSTLFYGYTTGSASPFRRNILIQTVNADEVLISVSISWQTGVLTKTFSIREHILNWQ